MSTLTVAETTKLFNDYVLKRYPAHIYSFKASKLSHFRKMYLEGSDWKAEIDKSLSYVERKSNYGAFWYIRGITDVVLIEKYKADAEWRFCKICDNLYHRLDRINGDFKAYNTCSLECNDVSRANGGKIISDFRKDYNPKNPEHYAKKHNISLEEATDIVHKVNVGGSHWRKEFWLAKGFTEEEAIENISYIQSKNSKRSIHYWMNRGLSEDDAIVEVKLYQSECGKLHKYCPEDSWLSVEYYLKRGYSIEEGLQLKKDKLAKSGETIKETSRNKTPLERQQGCASSIEYYRKRGIDDDTASKRIAEIAQNRRNKKYVSAISVEFCKKLEQYFVGDTLYHDSLNKEFYIWSKEKNGIYLYDFTDTSKGFIVEFHGNYWHSEKNKSWTAEYDAAKTLAAEKRGFKVFVIWESDYKADKELSVKNLANEIKEWYENHKC